MENTTPSHHPSIPTSESAPNHAPTRKRHRLKWVSLAACVCILAGVLLALYFGSAQRDLGPPTALPIDSIDDYTYILNSASAPDDELQDFLLTNQYRPIGIQNGDDLHRLLEPLYDVGCPLPKESVNLTSVDFLYYIGDSYIFEFVIDDVLYLFYYNHVEDTTWHPLRIPAKTANIHGQAATLYWGYNCLVGEIYEADYQIRIVARSFEDANDVNFDQFDWLYPTKP